MQGCRSSCRSRPGTTSRSTNAAWSCCLATRPQRPHDQGVLVICDTGDRKHGHHTAHVARQDLGSVGKTDNAIVAVTSLGLRARLLAGPRVALHPACRLPKGTRDPGFWTKPGRLASWCRPPARRGSACGWWWPTAWTAKTRASVRHLAEPGWPLCWRSSPARGCGRRPRRPTPRARRPPHWPGGARRSPGTGPGSPAGSATGTPRPGGRRPRRCPPRAGAQAAAAAGGGDHRLGDAAEASHLVAGHQPGSPQSPSAGTTGVHAGRPCRGGGSVRAAQLGRAGRQAGQGRARLGRLPGPQ